MRNPFVCWFAIAAALCAQPKPAEHWVGTWATAPQIAASAIPAQTLTAIHGQSIRMIVPATIGGHRVRVRFSNLYGKQPLNIASAHIAIRKEKAALVPGSDRPLLFGGRPGFAIPAGATALTDAVDLDVPDLTDLAVTVYAPGDVDLVTVHRTVPYAAYVSEAGDFTAAADLPKATEQRSWYWLEGVEVMAPMDATAIVALGDSITDGYNDTPDTNGSWPSVFAKRLRDRPGPRVAVLNLGISGNRILHDGIGTNALARFDTDVLAQPGARAVIVLEGTNDFGLPAIGRNSPNGAPGPFAKEEVSADDVIVGLRQIIERARAHGLKVYGATLLPFEGAAYFTPEGEAKRQAVNQWVRTGGAFDGVIDFDAVIRDPQHPSKMLAGLQSGDYLHPNNEGYKLMADSVDISTVLGRPSSKKK
jgi:lysophospholipase L1-like esterase